MLELIKVRELKLADKVRLFDQAYGDATVKQIKEDCVILTRPYVQTADFSYTGGVITYIGIEEVTLSLSAVVHLLERGGELK
jgi:hypothetical protein